MAEPGHFNVNGNMYLSGMKSSLKKFSILLVFPLLIISCSQEKKFNTPEELGRHVFDLICKQDGNAVLSLVVNEKDVETAFMNNEEFSKMPEKDKKAYAGETAAKNKANAAIFTDMYTKDNEQYITLMKSATWRKTMSEIRNENGTTISFMTLDFDSEGKPHELRLRAAKVNDHWKLLYWIEIK